ncbi:MAG: CPBP family intramembrane glutamic endopeptidase [Myxococcota bacterium]|nr:CPBP family intramembrane glutamic endopeptidase [Myxococcota bacterium]
MAPKLSLYLVLGLIAAALHIAVGQPLDTLFVQHGECAWVWQGQVLFGLAIGLFVIALSRYASTHWRWTQKIDDEFHLILGDLTARDIFALALLSSTVEEMFFRGFLQGQIGIGWSAIAFGVAHFPYRRALIPWTVAALGVGWVFGHIVAWQGNLIAVTVAHFVINYFNLHYILRPRVETAPTMTSPAISEFDPPSNVARKNY